MKKPLCHFQCLLLAMIVALWLPDALWAAGRTQRDPVLVLHSYHKADWTDRLLEGIHSVLDPLGSVDMNVEYMDTKKIKTREYLDRLADLYALKYAPVTFRAIITTDDNAYRFALAHQQDLFKNAPIVFCGVNRFDPAEIENAPNVTGVVEKGDFADTLQLARTIRPKAQTIHVIVDDSKTGQINKAGLLAVLNQHYPNLQPHFLEGVSLDDLSRTLRDLPSEDFAFFISFWTEPSGKPVSPDQLAAAFANCTVPIFGRSEWMLGKGMIGGKCVSGFRQGQTAARLARRILDGEDAAAIPVVTESPNPFMFDAALLTRFKVDPARLPADSIVVNRPPPSLWQTYRRELLMLSAVLGVLMVLTVVLAVNIGIRRRAENALKASEQRYRTLVENAADSLYVADERGRLIDVNPQACASLGYQREALLDRSIMDVDAHFSSWEKVQQAWEELTPGRPVTLESRHRRKDGTTFPVDLRISVYESRGRRFTMGLAHDVTERKLIEKNLKESEEKYRHLVQNAPAGIFELDLETMRFVSVNEVICEYTGYSRRELMEIDPLSLLDADSRRRMNRRLAAIAAGDLRQESLDYRLLGRDGQEHWVVMNARFSLVDGVAKVATVVVHDVTPLKNAEAEKARLETQLQQAQKMEAIGTLAGGIAHDFNNLLMGIQGNVSLMMLDVEPDGKFSRQLNTIERHVQRGVDLTRQLLGFARGGKYEIKPTDMKTLMDNCAAMFGQTRREVAIHQRHAADLWPVEADQGQMEQVLLNLFVNAWQAMPGGGDLWLETTNETLAAGESGDPGLAPGRYVRISVSDTGVGMDSDTLQRVFEPFFTTKEMGSGTGLGLASAYGIVKNHGGTITVDSRPGKGSRFVIRLPATHQTVVEEKRSPETVLSGSERILLVDDDPAVLDVGRAMLDQLGYSVETAASGQAATALCDTPKGRFDLVILDMIMSGMGGGETFDRLRAIDPDIKVLLSSGYSIDGEASDILRRGCNGFIQKPFDILQLSNKVREIIEA